jgi:hypothetical protein
MTKALLICHLRKSIIVKNKIVKKGMMFKRTPQKTHLHLIFKTEQPQ